MSSNGQFSVRSAFSLAVSLSQAADGGASSDTGLVGDFGSKFRAYLFPIRYSTLYGELVVRLFLQRSILLKEKWCWITPMRHVG